MNTNTQNEKIEFYHRGSFDYSVDYYLYDEFEIVFIHSDIDCGIIEYGLINGCGKNPFFELIDNYNIQQFKKLDSIDCRIRRVKKHRLDSISTPLENTPFNKKMDSLFNT